MGFSRKKPFWFLDTRHFELIATWEDENCRFLDLMLRDVCFLLCPNAQPSHSGGRKLILVFQGHRGWGAHRHSFSARFTATESLSFSPSPQTPLSSSSFSVPLSLRLKNCFKVSITDRKASMCLSGIFHVLGKKVEGARRKSPHYPSRIHP